jgi:hypothetical protein
MRFQSLYRLFQTWSYLLTLCLFLLACSCGKMEMAAFILGQSQRFGYMIKYVIRWIDASALFQSGIP